MAVAVNYPPVLRKEDQLSSLPHYLEQCRQVGADVQVVEQTALATLHYLKAGAEQRAQLRPAQDLEARWYAGLAAGQPDYGVYGDDAYLGDLWACWQVYSRKYLRLLWTPSREQPIPAMAGMWQVMSILDLGCGPGYTTAALSRLFAGAEVTGTNLLDTRQAQLAQLVGQAYGFQVLGQAEQPADLVFASEYFEHLPAPVAHLDLILDVVRPSWLVVANTFGSRSIGHFPTYRVGGRQVDGRATSHAFGALLRSRGYAKLPTGYWNDRPQVYRKES